LLVVLAGCVRPAGPVMIVLAAPAADSARCAADFAACAPLGD
jgi:hypothetical protein